MYVKAYASEILTDLTDLYYYKIQKSILLEYFARFSNCGNLLKIKIPPTSCERSRGTPGKLGKTTINRPLNWPVITSELVVRRTFVKNKSHTLGHGKNSKRLGNQQPSATFENFKKSVQFND